MVVSISSAFPTLEMDKYLYTIIVEGDLVGHVYKVGYIHVVISGDYPTTTNIREVTYTHKKDDTTLVMADYPLQTLSSRPFVITYNHDMVYGKYMYTTTTKIPASCTFTLMMVVGEGDIVEYTPTPYDIPFVKEGYAKDVKNAAHIILPTNTYEGDLSDLVIENRNGNVFTSINGRKTTLNVTNPSRYIVTNPTFHGEGVDIPYTYTIDSLISKTKELNDRLQSYGQGRVDSMVRALTCLIERMSTDRNKFVTSTNYKYIVEMIRLML